MKNTNKYDNSEKEYSIGAFFIFFEYLKMLIFYAIVGGLLGYFIHRSWKWAFIFAVIFVFIRIVVIKIFWKIIKFLVDLGSK